MNGLAIRLLGSPHIELDGKPAALETRKATALLAYLAVRRDPVSRDSLAALFWPDYEPTCAAPWCSDVSPDACHSAADCGIVLPTASPTWRTQRQDL